VEGTFRCSHSRTLRIVHVLHFSKFLQHPVTRPRTVPANQIAGCSLTKLSLLYQELQERAVVA